MKTQKLLFCFLLLFISGNILEAQSKKELKKQKRLLEYINTRQLVESGQFVFMIEWVVTQKGARTQALGEGLLIEGDQTYADLPFLGNSNRGELGSTAGIKFTSSETVFDVEYKDEKRKINLNFEANSPIENYNVSMTIMGNGNATLRVSSSARDIMSYEGKIKKVNVKGGN